MQGILDLFIPREKKFFDLLMELSSRTHAGGQLFMKFVSEYDRLGSDGRVKAVDKVKDIEHECDAITHTIAIELNKTFLTPIDREDIHRLSTLIDDFMDILYNVCHKLVLYNIATLPKFVPELARNAHDCSQELHALVSKMGTKADVNGHIKRIHELEVEADSLRNEAFAYIFNDSLSAVDVIKLKDIYEWLEAISDKCEDVADLVEGIVIKYA